MICICGIESGKCVDCYPQNFRYDSEKDTYYYIADKKIEKNLPPKSPILNVEKDVKLEKLESKKIDILEYVGKLGKLFTTVIKSSNYSEKVKNDLNKEFNSVEKYLKLQLKEENKEFVDKKSKQFRKYARKFFITIPKTEAPKKDVLNYYVKNPKMNIQKAAIAQENHKDGSLHLHVYLEFCAKKDIRKMDYFNLPEEYKQYGNISADWDTIKKRTKENIFGYMLKSDKNAYSYSFNIRKAALGKLKQKEIWYKIAIGEWTIKDYILYDPSIIGTINVKKLTERFIDNMSYIKNNHWNIDIKDFIW